MSVNLPPVPSTEFNSDNFTTSSSIMTIPVLGLPYIPLAGGTATGLITGPAFVSNIRNVSAKYTFTDSNPHTIVTMKPLTTTRLTVYGIDDLSKAECMYTTDGTGTNFVWAPATSGDALIFRNNITTSAANLLIVAGGAALENKNFLILAETVSL